MTKKKKPTMNELSKVISNMDIGLRGIHNILRLYVEYKGDAVAFNQFLDGKAKEQEEMKKQQEQQNDS